MKKKTVKSTKEGEFAGVSGSANLWRVTVNDGFCSWTYEIAGTDQVSIRQVMNAVTRRLKGKLVREWSGEGADSPNESSSAAELGGKGASCRCLHPSCSALVENDLTGDEIRKINSFGECWIRNFDHTKREQFKKALWLWAWDKRVIFSDGPNESSSAAELGGKGAS